MRPLVLSERAVRELRRFRRRHRTIADRLDRVLIRMQEDVYHSSLRTHKLEGALGQYWSCSVTYPFRILFQIIANPEAPEGEEIHIAAVGSHDEVY